MTGVDIGKHEVGDFSEFSGLISGRNTAAGRDLGAGRRLKNSELHQQIKYANDILTHKNMRTIF